MKKYIWAIVMILATSAYAEWAGPVPWSAKEELTDWQRCRYPGVDMIGLGKLIHFDSAKTNEQGVMATFQFTGMMKGEPGDYTITIPDDMRNPMEMTVDRGEWKWKEGETYGILCISEEYEAVRMVDWVIPMDQWGAFKASVRNERAEFEAFVKENKRERHELEKKIEGVWDREDLGEEEKDVRVEQIEKQNSKIYDQVQEKGFSYFILEFDWDDPDQTWPIEVDEREQRKRMLGL